MARIHKPKVRAKRKTGTVYAPRAKPFQQKVSVYISELEQLVPADNVNVKLLTAAAKACGPALYKRDAAVVASSDKSELTRVKEKFLIGRLGLIDSPKLDKAIKDVVEVFGTSHRRKYRAVFYYLLVKKLGIQKKLLSPSPTTNANKEFRTNLISFGKNLIQEQENIDPEIMSALDRDFFELI